MITVYTLSQRSYNYSGKNTGPGEITTGVSNLSSALNDERSIARVYERMKEYRNAIDIWKRLDRPREIMRIEKKMKKEEAKREQLNLF